MRADEAVCIGAGPRKDYLNIDKIILAAQQTGPRPFIRATAFWRKTLIFPKPAPSAGLVFIGPPRRLSETWEARSSAGKSPRPPGSTSFRPPRCWPRESLPGEEAAEKFAAAHGYPIVDQGGCREAAAGVVAAVQCSPGEQRRHRPPRPLCCIWDAPPPGKSVHHLADLEVPVLWPNSSAKHSTPKIGTAAIQRRHQKLIEIAPAVWTRL